MSLKRLMTVLGAIILIGAIAFSWGCQNQPTGPEGSILPTFSKARANIVVRARGTGGGEHIYVTVGGSQIADFNLTTSYADYSASTSNTGEVLVCFDNDDGENLDVQIDYIEVDGERRQAEDQSYNTGVWQNDECGGGDGMSEWLHCEGCIGFGNVGGGGGGTTTTAAATTTTSGSSWWGGGSWWGGSTTTTVQASTTTTTNGGYTTTTAATTTTNGGSSGHSISIRARGVAGGEHIYLAVAGSRIDDWTLSTSYENYTASTNLTGEITVCFDNDDGEDRDVQIDYIEVYQVAAGGGGGDGGIRREAEDQSYNTGVWQNGECGGGNGGSEMLHCEGCIGFGSVSGGDISTTTSTTTTSSVTTTTTTAANTTTTNGSSWWGGGSWWGSTTTTAASTTTTSGGYTTTTSGGGGGGTFHCFLLIGQSNMHGGPAADAADRQENDRILVLGYDNCSSTGRRENEWDVASPPLHSCGEGIGPGDWFAKTLIQNVPSNETIGLIPCAVSGEAIETFMRGGSHYNMIINRAKIAQQDGGVIEGILFHQGESNNGDNNWPNNVAQMVRDIKSDLGLGDIPFLPGELLYSGDASGHNTLVNQLPNVIPNCHVVSAEGLNMKPGDSWRLHFDHDSVVEFGKRYARAMRSALGW
jgi:hypothetical protein